MLDWKSFKPLHKWLLVKADPRVKKTKGGIELPDELTKIERVMEGTGVVLKVGDDVPEKSGVNLSPGDRIAFRGFLKDAFQEFEPEDDGQTIFLLRVEDVLAVIDENVQMGAFS